MSSIDEVESESEDSVHSSQEQQETDKKNDEKSGANTNNSSYTWLNIGKTLSNKSKTFRQ
jgi:hypothetical protein